jgi:hypothetical protein
MRHRKRSKAAVKRTIKAQIAISALPACSMRLPDATFSSSAAIPRHLYSTYVEL